jgi:hypothetical protein
MFNHFGTLRSSFGVDMFEATKGPVGANGLSQRVLLDPE